MSFKLFIYYCALLGGWAAFLSWGFAQGLGIRRLDSAYLRAALIAAVLGFLVAGAVGFADALLNAKGSQRWMRLAICLGVGLVGGSFGGLVGQVLNSMMHAPLVFGWILVGICIGASVGVFDVVRAVKKAEELHLPFKKTLNGCIGGCIGGLLGGLLFGFMFPNDKIPRTDLAIGLVVLGLCIGLMIGLAQVFLKEAWLKVTRGFRVGRELMLSKNETTIGRAESCDLGLFGDNTIERTHARILLKDNRYLLADADTPGGTFLNEQRIGAPTPLKSGDVIRVGNSVLEFGERQKRT